MHSKSVVPLPDIHRSPALMDWPLDRQYFSACTPVCVRHLDTSTVKRPAVGSAAGRLQWKSVRPGANSHLCSGKQVELLHRDHQTSFLHFATITWHKCSELTLPFKRNNVWLSNFRRGSICYIWRPLFGSHLNISVLKQVFCWMGWPIQRSMTLEWHPAGRTFV